jgi:hypothetical protein
MVYLIINYVIASAKPEAMSHLTNQVFLGRDPVLPKIASILPVARNPGKAGGVMTSIKNAMGRAVEPSPSGIAYSVSEFGFFVLIQPI